MANPKAVFRVFRPKVMIHHYGVLPVVGAVLAGGVLATSYGVYAAFFKPDVSFAKGRHRYMNVNPDKNPYVLNPKEFKSGALPFEDEPRRKLTEKGYEPQFIKELKEEVYVAYNPGCEKK